jgi:electron transfer flavoprotein alpha subunit
MKLIACTETRSDKIEAFSLEMIEAARSIALAGDEVVAFFAGRDAGAASESFGAADRLVAACAASSEMITAEAYARLLRDVITAENPDIVLGSILGQRARRGGGDCGAHRVAAGLLCQ